MPDTQVRGRGTRKDTFRVSLNVDGEDWGVWDSKTGGEVDSNENAPWKSGGMGPPIALGGQVTTGNVTLARLFTLEDDMARIQRLYNAAGRKKAVVKQIALDIDGNAYKTMLVWTGKLKRVSAPDTDSNSNDGATLEIEIVVDGTPTAM